MRRCLMERRNFGSRPRRAGNSTAFQFQIRFELISCHQFRVGSGGIGWDRVGSGFIRTLGEVEGGEDVGRNGFGIDWLGGRRIELIGR